MPIGGAPGTSVFGSRPLKSPRITVDSDRFVTLKLPSGSSPRGTGMRRNTGRLGIVTFVKAGSPRSVSRLSNGGAGLRRLGPPAALGRCAAVLIGIAFTWLAMLGPVSAAEVDDGVMIEGSGVLTTCRSWVLFTSCATHKVRLPQRVAAGDKVNLSYGSNPKNYTFEIALIRLEGDACTLLSESSRSEGEGEKIEVAHCGPFR